MSTFAPQQPQQFQGSTQSPGFGSQANAKTAPNPNFQLASANNAGISFASQNGIPIPTNSFVPQTFGAAPAQTNFIAGSDNRQFNLAGGSGASANQGQYVSGGSQVQVPQYTAGQQYAVSYPTQVVQTNQSIANQNLIGGQRVSYTTGGVTTTYSSGGVTTQPAGAVSIIQNPAVVSQYHTTGLAPYSGQSVIHQGVYENYGSSHYVGQPKLSYRSGGERVINETKLPSRVVEVRELPSHVVESRELQSYEVSRHVITDANARVTEHRLPSHEQRPSVTKQTGRTDLAFRSEKAVINQRVVEKFIDVTIEKPVPNYIEKIVPYDVIVERPREIITERDVITEVVVERPFEKVVEVPIQKIVEVPIKKTIERISYVDVVRPVVVERVVDRQVEQIVENLVYHDNVVEVDEKDLGKYHADAVLPTETRVYRQDQVRQVEKIVPKMIEKTVEVPREVIVQNPVARHVDRPVEVLVDRPVYIQRPVEKIVEVPFDNPIQRKKRVEKEIIDYVDEIIEQQVDVPKYVDRPRQVVEERVVHKDVPVDRVVEKRVDRLVQKPVYVEKQVVEDLPEYIERPRYVENVIQKEVPRVIQQEVIYETVVPVEREHVVEETIYVPIEKIIDRPVERVVEKYVDNIIEKEVIEYNIIEDVRYVDRDVTVQVEKRVDNPIVRHNVIYKPRYVERVVEKKVPRNVEKVVEVPVERRVEVPVEVVIEVPVFVEKKVYKDVYVNKNVRKSGSRVQQQGQDFALKARVESQRGHISQLKTQIARSRAEFENWSRKQVNVTLHSDIDYTSQNEVLKRKIAELEQAIKDVNIGKIRKSLLT